MWRPRRLTKKPVGDIGQPCGTFLPQLLSCMVQLASECWPRILYLYKYQKVISYSEYQPAIITIRVVVRCRTRLYVVLPYSFGISSTPELVLFLPNTIQVRTIQHWNFTLFYSTSRSAGLKRFASTSQQTRVQKK